MDVTFAPNGYLQIDDARLVWRNFSGEETKFNRAGDRNFAIVIPDADICVNKAAVNRGAVPVMRPIVDALMDDTNKYGVGWNVKIKPPRDEDDTPFTTLKVKVSYKGRGPKAYLTSGNRTIELTEDTIDCLDSIDIARVDLDIRPYDDEFNGRPFRSAYLESIHVVQEIDRFAARFAEEEYPEE